MLTPLTLKQVQAECESNIIPIYKDELNRYKYIIDQNTTIFEV